MRWVVGLVVLLGLVGRAHAEDVYETAAKLVAAGNDAWDAGEYQMALDDYSKAHDLVSAPKLYYNIGLALEQLGRTIEAAAAYESFLAEATDARDALRADAKSKLGALDHGLGHLVVRVHPQNAVARVDGREMGPAIVRVPPGTHTVTVMADGYQPDARKVTVMGGETRELEVTLSQLAAMAPEHPPVPARRFVSRPWYTDVLGDALAGGGVVALGLGTGFLIAARSDDQAARGAQKESRYQDLVDRASSRRTVGALAAGAGAGLLGVAVLRYVLHSRRVEVAPAADGQSASLAVQTHF
jgi:tetratricopeptide (TPR) repeat protein